MNFQVYRLVTIQFVGLEQKKWPNLAKNVDATADHKCGYGRANAGEHENAADVGEKVTLNKYKFTDTVKNYSR